MSDAPAATAVTVTDNGNVERMISMNNIVMLTTQKFPKESYILSETYK